MFYLLYNITYKKKGQNVKYQIKIGWKKDQWFILEEGCIVKIFYSVLKAQKYLEEQEHDAESGK